MLTAIPAAQIGACLITKTDTNPFFLKMKEGATQEANENGISLQSYVGKIDGDVATQVAAVETCIVSGASGILITASDSRALVPVISQVCEAGLLVIALDTPFEPADAADATFATDNFKAGVLIGQWATATLGVKESKKVLELILDVKARGMPIVLISHNMPHVFEVADRIHIHRLGRRICIIKPENYQMSDAVAIMTGAAKPPN